MAQSLRNLIAISGLYISGDVGPYTTYTSKRHRKVVYLRSPPLKPPTAAQIAQRARFTAVAADWRATSANDKAAWEQCTLRTSIPMTGYNLFTFAETAANSTQYLETLFRQAKLLPVPPFTPR